LTIGWPVREQSRRLNVGSAIHLNGGLWPASVRSPAMLPSDLGLLRHLEGIVDFNAEVAHCTFQLGMSEQ